MFPNNFTNKLPAWPILIYNKLFLLIFYNVVLNCIYDFITAPHSWPRAFRLEQSILIYKIYKCQRIWHIWDFGSHPIIPNYYNLTTKYWENTELLDNINIEAQRGGNPWRCKKVATLLSFWCTPSVWQKDSANWLFLCCAMCAVSILLFSFLKKIYKNTWPKQRHFGSGEKIIVSLLYTGGE